MDTLSFLRLVLPEQGLYLLAVPAKFQKNGETHNYHRHLPFTDIGAMAQTALAMSCDREDPINVFFALSTVKEDFTKLKKAERDAQGVKVRGGNNSDRTRAFWLDLDVGADPHKYATQGEAAEALRAFCAAMSLPRPYVSSSGGGLHVYWPLTESLDADTWIVHAAILKALTESYGLRADPARTADVASILRPVGTYNWKTGRPRPVELVVAGHITDTGVMLNKLQQLKANTQVVVPERRIHQSVSLLGTAPSYLSGEIIPAVNIEAATGAGYAQPLASDVVKKCQQLLWQRNNPQLVSEPAWYAMIGCLRFAEKGYKAVHLMSQGHPSYTPERTDDKLMQAENSGTGPTLCATFASHNPGGCDGCPMKDKIKTPLQAVRALEAAPAPTVTVETEAGGSSLTLPPPPKPYKRVVAPGCEAGRIAIRREEEQGESYDEVIYEFDIFPTEMTYDERDQAYYVTVRTWLPHEGWQERNIPTGKFFDRRSLSQTLGSIGVMVDLGRVDEVVQYMIAYIRELQKQSAAKTVYAQLGWRDDKNLFILPDRVVSAQGVAKIEPSSAITNALSWVEPRGDLEVWKRVASVYNREGLEALQFLFGVGFAAPLFRFTNFNGALVSAVGQKGSGKSSALMLANSIWGHKKNGWADMQHDTKRAFYGKLGALNNLPATYDETTNLSGEDISELTYAVTKGQGRQRLQANGQAQENYGNWCTLMATSANSSMVSALSNHKADSSAEASRIFEYTVPSGTLTKAEADENFDLLNDHFGLAAVPYAQALVTHREWARERVKHWVREVDRMSGTGSSERFWSAVVASVLTGFELANKAGLTSANIERLLKFSLSQIGQMRGTMVEQTRNAESLVADYINSNLRSMLALNSDRVGKTLAQVTIQPSSDKLLIRLERHKGRLYIDRADFRRFCGSRNADAKQVHEQLKAAGILLADNSKCVLGKDTVYSGAQSWCWVLDFNNPALSGSAAAVQAVQDNGSVEQEEAV